MRFTRKVKLSGFILSFFLLFVFISNSAFAVSEAAALFLLISPSPQANAMGETYGNIVGKDPMATLFNPASLGLLAQNHYFATSYLSPKVNWLPALASEMNYFCRSIALGMNLKSMTGLPISSGISLNNVRLNLGEHSWEEARSTSIAFAIDYYVKASFGYTHKTITSNLAPDASAEINAHDLGFILKVPVVELVDKFQLLKIEKLLPFQPYLVPGFYYSLTNIGDKIFYIDPAQADPIPRNVSAGINFETGINYKIRDFAVNLFSFGWSREADDLLIKTYSNKPSEYVCGLNDIKLWNNIIIGKSNDKIISKKGWQFDFGNFYSIRKGKYEDIEGEVIFKSEGYNINFLQPLRILLFLTNAETNNNFVNKLIMSLNFEYHYSKFKTSEDHPLHNTKFNGYVVSINNFPFHK
jgi:hypothetical protein